MEDAAAGLELVFSTLFCKQNGSCNEYYVDRFNFCLFRKEIYNVVYRGVLWVPVVCCLASSLPAK